jgi:hypothetical protein
MQFLIFIIAGNFFRQKETMINWYQLSLLIQHKNKFYIFLKTKFLFEKRGFYCQDQYFVGLK